ASDAAFVINEHADGSASPSGRLRLAVSVRSLKFFQQPEEAAETYSGCVARMVTVAVREFGATVTFLSTCQGMPEYWTNDAASAAEVVALLPPDVCKHVNIDANFRQPQQVAIAYADFDLVIATRMHAAILAMTAGTPVIGLAYEFKMDELFKQF